MRNKPQIALSADHKRIIWHLRTMGPAPRIAIAHQLGMHNGALTRLTRELLMLDVVDELEQAQGGPRGRPSVPLALSSRGGYAAGATVHPGWLEIALVDFAGATVARDVAAFDSSDPRDFVQHVDQRLRALSSDYGLMRSRFLGLGVGIPGYRLLSKQVRHFTVDWLKGWREVEAESFFADCFGFPVWVENDATVAALAEFYDSGLIRTCSSALLLLVGHGVGGGIIHRRDVMRGEFGNAGEIGRLFPMDQPRPSGIDLLACLRREGARIRSLFELESYLESHGELVEAWAARAGKQLGFAANAGAAWLDPGAIILSGALPQKVLAAVGKHFPLVSWGRTSDLVPLPVLHISRLGGSAVAMGAALLPIHQLSATAGA